MKAIWLWVQEVGNAPTDSVPHPATFHGWYYPAAEVDAYRRKVAVLVEAAMGAEKFIAYWFAGTPTGERCLADLKAAIAAVEENP